MKRPLALAFTAAVVGVCALTAMSQPPAGRGPGGKKGGPPGFELGRVLPPFVRDDLDLTADQERQLAALEAEVRQKLEKILTVEQRKRAAGARPPFGPPPFGKDGPPPRGFGPPPGKDGPPPRKDDGEQVRAGGIQWFATWEAGKAEAERTGRPILFVSAAPHCAGVSGIW
jgi:hypothetical protein